MAFLSTDEVKKMLLKLVAWWVEPWKQTLWAQDQGYGKEVLRVRVEVDISCPLVLGFLLEREQLPDLWIPFKFEKLGNFCFGCGMLGHDQHDYQDKGVQTLLREGVNFSFFGR